MNRIQQNKQYKVEKEAVRQKQEQINDKTEAIEKNKS